MPAPEVNMWDTRTPKDITDYGLHPAIMNKLKLKNFILAMEKVNIVYNFQFSQYRNYFALKRYNYYIYLTCLEFASILSLI